MGSLPARPRSNRAADIFVWRLDQLLREEPGRAAEVARRTGIAEGTLSKWRRGKARPNPKLDTLARIARALGIRACDLIAPP